jgi:uncharacterized membrane protein
MKVGVWFYGLATVLTGILDIVWGEFEASHQPIRSLGQHIPGQQVLAYIAGVWLIAAGMAILWRRTARKGAAGAALIYLVFALVWLPRFYSAAHVLGIRIGVMIFVLGGVAAEVLLVAPVAIVYAGTEAADPVWRERAAIAGRWMLGLSPIAFGLGHLINLHAYARFVPHWVPFATFWVVVTGIAFVLAGGAIVSGIRDVLAARLLVLMLLLFDAIVEIPPVFVHPHSQVAWGGAVYNLAAIGAYCIFVEFVANRRKTHRGKIDIAEHVATSHPHSVIAGFRISDGLRMKAARDKRQKSRTIPHIARTFCVTTRIRPA